MTIENLNSWQSLWLENQDRHWTLWNAFAILAMFFLWTFLYVKYWNQLSWNGFLKSFTDISFNVMKSTKQCSNYVACRTTAAFARFLLIDFWLMSKLEVSRCNMGGGCANHSSKQPIDQSIMYFEGEHHYTLLMSSHLLDVTVLSEVRPTSLQVSKFKLIKHKSKVKSVAKVEFIFSWSLFPDQYLQRNEEVVHYALWGGARVEKRIVGNSL